MAFSAARPRGRPFFDELSSVVIRDLVLDRRYGIVYDRLKCTPSELLPALIPEVNQFSFALGEAELCHEFLRLLPSLCSRTFQDLPPQSQATMLSELGVRSADDEIDRI
jgi:hypothetical protein